MYTKLPAFVSAGFLGWVALAGCDLDVPNLNNPGLDQLQDNPTAALVNSAADGLQVGIRGGKAATTGLVNQLGILGRESYDFDSADSRFVTEEISGPENRSDAFGGVFWAANFANIQLGFAIVHALDKVADLSDSDKAGIRGYVHTLQAYDFLIVIETHRETGAPIDVDRPLGSALAPFVTEAEVYVEINRLLDLGQTELAASDAFTFDLNSGFNDLAQPMESVTPADFILFNRALRARVAAYTADYPAALTALQESFLVDDPAKLDFTTGVYFPYSTAAGDVTNALINKAIYAHPALLTDVQMQPQNPATPMVPPGPDARFQAKLTVLKDTVGFPTDASLKTTLKFAMYTNVTSVPLIRNEELILLKAEALWFTGDKAGALAELNIVRTLSGKLAPIATVPADDTAFEDALLFERRYSLLFEGGHRWLDLLRFNRPLPLDDPQKHVQNVRYPVPQAECDARPGEPACVLTSIVPAAGG